MAPASMPPRTRSRIFATSFSRAARSEASGPITMVRTAEWPIKAATFGVTPLRLSNAKYSSKLSKSQFVPLRSAVSDMPSTSARLRAIRSRQSGGHGAMEKPQLPTTTVVTPIEGEGVAFESQVSCAS